MTRHAAVDLGATSGRVVVADITADSIDLREVHRFANGPVEHSDGLHWDITGLHREAIKGLSAAGTIDSVGVDSWAIDYGLVAADGTLLNEPWCYRDSRCAAARLPLSAQEQFARNGLQRLPFTTINQLAVDVAVPDANAMLLIPDLLTFWLTGEAGCEITNASTTGLLDVRTGTWAPELLAAAGIASGQLPPLVVPGERRGRASQFGADVIAVGSHDTASAFVGAPLSSRSAACISLGTWGLVGVELDEPVLTGAAFAANFTNELGVDGRTRFLRNVVGLWILEQCLQDWGLTPEQLPALLADAAALGPTAPFDLTSDTLMAPGDMPARLVEHIDACGLPPAQRRPHLVRYILDSLVEALAETLVEAARLSAVSLDVIHVVGGGARNTVLCQLLAERTGLTVLAGPFEATALGNVLVQARACGTLSGSLEDLRDLTRRAMPVVRYDP